MSQVYSTGVISNPNVRMVEGQYPIPAYQNTMSGINAPSQMIDTMMMGMAMNFASKGSARDQLLACLVLVMKPQIQEGVTWLATAGTTMVKKYMVDALPVFMAYLFGLFFSFIWKDKEVYGSKSHELDADPMPPMIIQPFTIVSVRNWSVIAEGLISWIQANPSSCTYVIEDNCTINIPSATGGVEKTQTWTDMRLEYNGTHIHIPINMIVTTMDHQGTTHFKSLVIKGHNKCANEIVTRFTNLIPDGEFKTEMVNRVNDLIIGAPMCPKKDVHAWYNYGIWEEVYVPTCVTYLDVCRLPKTVPDVVRVAALLKLHFPNLNLTISSFELIVFSNLVNIHPSFIINMINKIETYGVLYIYSHKLTFADTSPSTFGSVSANIILPHGTIHNLNKLFNTSPIHVQYIKYMVTSSMQEFTQMNSGINANELQLVVQSKSDIPAVDAFINAVKGPGQRVTSKIKVHLINIEYTRLTTDKPNPEYTAFMRKLELIEKGSALPPPSPPTSTSTSTLTPSPHDPSALSSTSAGGISSNPPPPTAFQSTIREQITRRKIETLMDQEPMHQTIVASEVVRKFVVEYKGETMKHLDNVFMQAEDKSKFVGALTRFKEDKTLMEELGVPNKLNIMLCGPPGTGKSTCVVAAATYLGKDIYYVNGASIKSNRDLQEVYDYIPKHCPQGGILVFEDVDAACPVLLRRNHTATRDKHIPSFLPSMDGDEDGEVTLDYWLNLAQGIVTPDGLIAIFTTNHLGALDPAFCRDGRIDCTVHLGNCDSTQVAAIYHRFIQSTIPPQILDRIQINTFAPVNVISQCIKYVHSRDTDPEEIMAPFLST